MQIVTSFANRLRNHNFGELSVGIPQLPVFMPRRVRAMRMNDNCRMIAAGSVFHKMEHSRGDPKASIPVWQMPVGKSS